MEKPKLIKRNGVFYVYVWLDIRKSGEFIYGDYLFKHEPIYVGKGKGKRYKDLYKRNPYLSNKIQNLEDLLHVKLVEDVAEHIAFEVEKRAIKAIGRIDLKTGPLINYTDGGEGPSNPSEETRNKISEKIHKVLLGNQRRKGIPHSEESKKNMSLAGKGKPKSALHKLHIKQAHKGGVLAHSESTKQKMSNSKTGSKNNMFGKHHSEGTRKAISESNKLTAKRKNEQK